ncbi:MAG: mitochondrial fission ELM1 family protein [Candidatus Competibacteraceae bacterium]
MMATDPPSRPSSLTATVSAHRPPRVWLLMGYKAGDNTQIQALAEALGWPFEIKRLVYRRTELLTNILMGRTLAGIVRQRSSPLEPPWPDLVISAGRRNEPVARWIRDQAGGQVRLVHMGRPWADLAQFDLIVTTPQYELPERPNVLHNLLPLQRITAERLAAAATRWAPRLEHLPAPRIALLVGGNSGPYTLDRATATYLGQTASRLALEAGGSLLLTTSARTPRAAATALTTALTAPAYCFQWTPQRDDNPYFGYLALADAFIVTGDSISMLTEACATCKPVYIFAPDQAVPIPEGGWQRWQQRWERLRFDALIHRLGVRLKLRQLRRDIGRIHQLLLASGRAAWLGQPFPPGPPLPPLEDLARATARVEALFAAPLLRGEP